MLYGLTSTIRGIIISTDKFEANIFDTKASLKALVIFEANAKAKTKTKTTK